MLQADLKSFATLHSQLEQHEAKIRRLVDANIIGIIIWERGGRILEANDAFLRIVDTTGRISFQAACAGPTSHRRNGPTATSDGGSRSKR